MNSKKMRPAEEDSSATSAGPSVRVRAEQIVRDQVAGSPVSLDDLSPEETQLMLHELRVHQIELELQNEELRRSQLELETAQARYFRLYDLAPVGYFTISKKGLILQANLAAASLLSAERGQLVGQPISRHILKEDQDIFYLNRKQIFEFDEPRAFELRMVKSDGTSFWAHLTANAALGADGAQELRVALNDITARVRADESLQESETRYRALAETAADAIVTADSEGRIVGWNRSAERMFGYMQEEIIGQPVQVIMPERYRAAHATASSTVVAKDPRDFEQRAREVYALTRDGREVPVEIALSKWRIRKGVFITGIIRDITERREAENEVRKLSRAVEQSPAAVMITDRTGNIEYVNPQFEEITGYVNAEVLNHNPRILKSGKTSAETYREIWTAISAGGKWRGELHNRKKSGELYWEDAAISGLKDENGQVTHFIGVKADITASKQAAEALREMRQREVGIGASIQRSLLGEVPEAIEGAQLAAYADPSQIMDGDFYAVRRYGPDCFEVLVGDVMGKGVQAALMGAGIITAYNRALADLLVTEANAGFLPTPAQIVNAMHLALTPPMIAMSLFATLALYRFYLDAGTLIYVNAGHTPGLLTRGPGARPVAILGDNLPIGVTPDEVYVQFSLTVGPGDSLLLFSDGITEARNPEGEDFGLERLSDLIEVGSKAELPLATLLHALRGEQRRYTGGGPGADDLTALMVELHPRRRAPRGGIADRIAPFVFTLPWSLEGLGGLRARITECAGSLSEADTDALILASFEAATNIIRYSRLLVGDATLACRITREVDALIVELIYPSAAFTPPAELRTDFSGEAEGGFGLFIIEQSVDSVEYASPMPGVASIRLVKRARDASA